MGQGIVMPVSSRTKRLPVEILDACNKNRNICGEQTIQPNQVDSEQIKRFLSLTDALFGKLIVLSRGVHTAKAAFLVNYCSTT